MENEPLNNISEETNLPEMPAANAVTGVFPPSEVGNVPFPGEVKDLPGGGIVLSKLDDLVNWARSNSLWPLTFATSCCGIEMMAVASAKYDFSRFGFEVARATPRQADVIIIAGTIVNKMGPVLKRL